MTELAQTPAAAQEAARLRLKQREDALKANAIKQGRALERAELTKEIEALKLEHEAMLRGIKDAQADEIARTVRPHEKASFWLGGILGVAAGAIFASAGYLLVVDKAMQQAFDRAQEISAASTLVGAATQRQAEP